MKTTKNKNPLIGKYVIVRTNVAGVHAGILDSVDGTTAMLKSAYRLWRVYTRDKSGSISDVAANGLKPNGGHSIGAKLERVMLVNPNGLEIAQMTDAAYKSLEEWAGK